jgi:hypothetical protein
MSVRPAKSTVWLSLGEIANHFSVTSRTVLNWVLVGTKDVAGSLHRLQAVRIGSRYCVKRRWLREYLAAMQVHQSEQPAVEAEGKKQKRFQAEQEAVKRRLGK